jgi:hypothetical protein
MALTYKIRYKNHCTPQEQILTNGRWYLDSDCGRKLTGNADTSATLSATGTLATASISTDGSSALSSTKDFIYIKNTGSVEVLVSLISDTSAYYLIALAEGEAFASEVDVSANLHVKTASGTSTVEYFVET